MSWNIFVTFLNKNILLILLVCLGLLLRFYSLGTIPDSLNIDELALGYNSYSLLHTGTDEHGKFLPLSLESFGDWKLPIYPVIDMVPIGLLGLTEVAVRIPSVTAGSLDIIILYLLALEVFHNKKIGLVAALFCCLSPWNIYFSRIAFEVNVATTFFLLALLLFFKYFHTKKSFYVVIAACLLGVTLFTYHAYTLFTPIFVIAFLFHFRKKFLINKSTIIAAVIFILFFIVSFVTTLQTSIVKLHSISVFNSTEVLVDRMLLRADYNGENPKVKEVLYNKVTMGLDQIGQNYLASFSPSFLFDKGGDKLTENLGYFGNLYLIDAIFLVFGVSFLLWNRDKNLFFLCLWLLLAPIPSAITNDSPNSTRLYSLFPLFILIESYGVYCLYEWVKKYKYGFVVNGLMSLFFVVNVVYFVEGYYEHVNVQRAEFLHYGYKQIVAVANQYPNDHIVMTGPENFPYISFLFYNTYDPRLFQKQVSYYPQTGDFLLVKSFGRYNFVETIDYTHIKPGVLYIAGNKPSGYTSQTVNLPDGRAVLWYFTSEDRSM